MKKITPAFVISISLFISISCSNEAYSSAEFKETFMRSNWECIDTSYTEGLPALTYDIHKSTISFKENTFDLIVQSASVSIYNNDTTIQNSNENRLTGNYLYHYPSFELQDSLTSTYQGKYLHTENKLTLYYMNKHWLFVSYE